MPFLNEDLLQTVQELNSSKTRLTEEQKQNLASQINDVSGYTISLLRYAVLHNDRPLLKCLLKLGAKVDIFDRNGNLPIHFSGDYGIIKMLVQANKDTIHIRNGNGYLSLHRAIAYKRYNVVRYLLQQGADPNAELPDGTTVWDIYPHSETLKNLLERYTLEEYKKNPKWISNQESHTNNDFEVSPNFAEVQENKHTIKVTNDYTEKTEFTRTSYLDFYDWTY